MNEDTTEYKLLITKSGEQIPISTTPQVSIKFVIPGDPVVNHVPLDVTPDEFEQIQELAKTNSIGDDILSLKDTNAS
jgi:hypothetical protein